MSERVAGVGTRSPFSHRGTIGVGAALSGHDEAALESRAAQGRRDPTPDWLTGCLRAFITYWLYSCFIEP